MVIVLTGGGSGGHITPLLATAAELKKLAPEVKLVFIGQKGDRFAQLAADHPAIDESRLISAGKFRRYHGEGWGQLLDVKTLGLNLRDFFRFIIGMYQAWRLLAKLKPSVIFIKGGFVGVPVGLAAASRKIPFVTHDSDAIPGLANRIISRWASYHAVALPASEYKNYPAENTVTVGVPLQAGFVPVNVTEQAKARELLGFGNYEQLLLVTGGGLGAQRLNDLVVKLAPGLLARFPRLALIHQTGDKQESQVKASYERFIIPADMNRVRAIGFVTEMVRYSAAADVIITRAGATNLAEFAAQAKACIIVPNPNLAGGHQTKNAELLENSNAALMVKEGKAAESELLAALNKLLTSASERQVLSANLAKLAHTDAASKLAKLLLEVASGEGKGETTSSQNNNKNFKS